MSETDGRLFHRAAELGSAFDRSFAVSTRQDPPVMESLLAIHMGKDACLLRLAETVGLFMDKKITPVPSRVATLLGIAGFRGTTLPVYDLHAFLGQTTTEPPRWLVIAAAAPIALAFQKLDGHLQVPPKDVLSREESQQKRQYVHDFAYVQGLVRPIVHLPSILDAIRQQQTEATRDKER